ncbi:MAG: 1-phosphofructokinase [Ignavibacteria bacterium RIFOXYB2_FULL_35_12]|nr:MAG: 1-phosphofructokinase [Ignavibacteria bacterium GWA2_36_19]OGU50046.1 MAG: 1-phosphofructokinase [Ignavibacteria bacterium GWC2_35_8]OGU63025.1 MAG: 1-phosphofructokinase [Ignavibacteria bacterium GWF2_35_20]OGU80269.1 MAG: 1-phosphofructokinase [Ignavibacteria bacterium RIFOXYA2_FULL_35_9]OGU85040.1 MAG: 1-phosphofructokinase [Ignavibacteria bacterium RBG_16_35_7]OGU88987.1 MAG: 1-phosphofructokinase [Ignavibacteria bacterium RIFOXYA12_FULL_35_25]OGU90918.1 MAG: 1-phosphofructokinase
MILTVTLNPLLEHRLAYKVLHIGKENRSAVENYKAGGKGINVSRQLNVLSVDNLAFTFLGGSNGKILKKLLGEEKINFTFISTHSETRSSAIILDESNKSITSYFGNDPQISLTEAEEFKFKLDKMIQNCEMVVFSGSSPCEVTNSIFPFGIQAANKHDKISICDTYGTHLKDCIDASPTILHNNIDEVEKSLKVSLRSENQIIDHIKFLNSKNIKQAYITDGANPTYAANFDFKFKATNPKVETIDSTGSGDSFVAGIVYGWHKNLPFEESLIIASSLGAANSAKYEVCNVTLEEVNAIKDKIEVIPLGKKMRLIDVKPV